MVFYPPKWAGQLPPIPDTLPICDFILDERYGRAPIASSPAPFICNVTGKSYPPTEVTKRIDAIARALSHKLDWEPNTGAAEEKVLGIFSVNTINTLPLSWAVHRLSGIVSPANASFSAGELAYQLSDSKATALFTCSSLLDTALQAADKVGIARQRVFLLETPDDPTPLPETASQFQTLEQLITTGRNLPALPALNWQPGQGRRQPAYLCYSSGTSGVPKGVLITHYSTIANILQFKQYDEASGARTPHQPAITSCILPMSHAYGLNYICQYATYRGDSTVVFTGFQLESLLHAIQQYRITDLYLVPPIAIRIVKNRELCQKYDLTSLRGCITGAAPLGEEVEAAMRDQFPGVWIGQGYGLTEATTIVSLAPTRDQITGSVGCAMPNSKWKLLSPSGTEITTYDTPGELLVSGPQITNGYLNNPSATAESFHPDGWYHTGDVGVIRQSPSGNEHLFIIDRIKELIKVKGLQVAPAELEAHLLALEGVVDCAVIPVGHGEKGEVPKAFVVRDGDGDAGDEVMRETIVKHVRDGKARHKWLVGGVEFVEVIPKSPSGKILRRVLREGERRKLRERGAKI
ncbi:acyl-CoA synthetase [Aspergillus sclerotioniger CBS 115572]|uniref:Acyl-CoA synthetase n=1 Tax=Aspergillus sclerotioniger CBS 115572 TaxID=1450535 RepID=A0A317X8S4_9EURO|nr:acyl-CoA synthetase [Aspergillus sclerotioniger CBS 115572]PWY93977.1 acyl-CoA synthetase [Aspergillus sclerotioniger CBS 115572]